jgi:hypothetical protein
VTAPLLGADDLGALLKHTPEWVRDQCRAGRLPHHRVGKRYLFTPEDVADIFAATAIATRPEDPPAPRLPRRDRLPSYRRVGSTS